MAAMPDQQRPVGLGPLIEISVPLSEVQLHAIAGREA